MSPKEFLQQYRVCCRKYQGILESIEQTRSMAEKTTQAFSGDRVSSSACDRLGSIAAILADMETEARAELTDLAAKKVIVVQAINAIPHDNQRDVLYQWDVLYHRYILQKKWEQVAVDLDLDLRWIFRIHREALQKIKFDH